MTHYGQVEDHLTHGAQASCSCGWAGHAGVTAAVAATELAAHYREATDAD